MKTDFDIAVIGTGASGTMAFLRCVLNQDKTVLFTGDKHTRRKSRAQWVTQVENIPGFQDQTRPLIKSTRSTLKWIFEHPQLSSKAFKIDSRVTSVKKENFGFKLFYQTPDGQQTVTSRFVILATGVMDVQPEINGSIRPILPYANKGHIIYCIICDGHHTMGHSLSIISPATTGVQLGAVFVERYNHKKISIITNGHSTEIAPSARRLFKAYNMNLYTEPIVEVLGNPRKEGLTGYKLADGTRIETTRSVVALGAIVYNELLVGLGGEVDERGRVIVDHTYETTVDDFFAVGDLVSGRKLQIYTAWEEAVEAANQINMRLRMTKRRRYLETL